jgi:hypothetical protein
MRSTNDRVGRQALQESPGKVRNLPNHAAYRRARELVSKSAWLEKYKILRVLSIVPQLSAKYYTVAAFSIDAPRQSPYGFVDKRQINQKKPAQAITVFHTVP